MHMVMTLGLSWAAGLHAALLGAWKDSPFESFKPGSFVRELLIDLELPGIRLQTNVRLVRGSDRVEVRYRPRSGLYCCCRG